MDFSFLTNSLSEVPVCALGTLSTVRLRASLLSRISLKMKKSIWLGLGVFAHFVSNNQVAFSRTSSKIAKSIGIFFKSFAHFVPNNQVALLETEKLIGLRFGFLEAYE